MIQVPICQWILPSPKKGWQVLANPRLSKPKQVDRPQQISPTPHIQSHSQPIGQEIIH